MNVLYSHHHPSRIYNIMHKSILVATNFYIYTIYGDINQTNQPKKWTARMTKMKLVNKN